MSLYQTPIRPYDPVIQDVGGASRYLRDNFAHTGQDSHTEPPAQDQSMWALLKNIMPITKGTLQRRWGYNAFANGLASGTNKLYSYQRDSDGLRLVVSTGGTHIQATRESGVSYSSNVYTPTQANLVRMVASRSYAYFFNNYAADLKKWDGNTSVTNIGINVEGVTSGTVFGPDGPGTAADLADQTFAWANVNNIKVNDGNLATVTVPAGSVQLANTLQATNFGLTPTGLSVVGIQVDVKYTTTNAKPITVQLTKDNGIGNPVAYGAVKTAAVTDPALGFISFGSPTDLWGGVWSTGDIQATSFGIRINVPPKTTPGFVSQLFLDSGGSFNTGSGVSIAPPLSGTNASGYIDVAQTGGTQFNPLFSATGIHLSVQGSGYTSPPAVTFPGFGPTAPTAHSTVSTDGLTMTAGVDYVRITVYVVAGAGITISSTASAGAVNLTVGRVYYEAFKNSTTGHYSGISTASASTGPLTNKEASLALSQNNDPQVDTNVILATADGGDPSILYLVAEVPASTTTFIDDTTENELVNGQVLVFTDDFGNETGIVDNDPPPVAGNIVLKHQGRLWMAQGQNLFFSKSVGDLTMPNGFIAGKYEEAWPAGNYFDISEGAETVSGLLSDGTNLYIGTQNHVRIVTGNDPTNFSLPEIAHPNVGVLNQEVWQLVYMEGSPAGSIWLTPDFRVIGSDFNTYLDIGGPVQNLLNAVQPTAATLTHSMMVSDGEFDLYILALPVNSSVACDTHLVYDMRARRWFQWTPADNSLGALFNITSAGIPQWLFAAGTNIFQYTAAISTDNGTKISQSAVTSFLHLGEPIARKVLDDLEVVGDSSMTVNVDGASTQTDFASPVSIVSGSPLVKSPFGQSKVYLATKTCKHRYYRLTFNSSSTSQAGDLLDSFSLRYAPFHTL